ncbi:MAG: AAA family ATPase [Deltaproteobacteria bacterium]|nr:AAA family ATPase [Deltaproteobacteria bacterium]
MLIHEITLKNFLSYGESSPSIKLGPLNILIGPNGSGKSNLLEAIELVRSAPEQFLKPIREGGGVREWLYKKESSQITTATLNTVINYPGGTQNLRYVVSFTAAGQFFEITDERIENEMPDPYKKSIKDKPYFYYALAHGKPTLNVKTNKAKTQIRNLQREDVSLDKSILAQRRDPDQYPEITYLAENLGKIRLYREWSFGRYTPARLPQRADLPNDMLENDASNLGLVLNRLRQDVKTKKKILEALQYLYADIYDYEVRIEGGSVQIFFQENTRTIPATRLSDGTLRYLSLLAILLQPSPPPLVCIEEPELGMHPDILPKVAELLKDASTRMQLIVATHSDILVDAMTDMPEAVMICEKTEQGSQLRRLDAQSLAPWLEDYRLGYLWTRGDIGGNRW